MSTCCPGAIAMKKLRWIVAAGMMVGVPGPLQAEDLHGSIAFSQDDDSAYAWGIAWSFDSSAGAQSEALGQCRAHGGTRCAEVGWFREACGALAIGDDNGYGTGWGATTGEAERDALAQCRGIQRRLPDRGRALRAVRGSRWTRAPGGGKHDSGPRHNDTRLASASPVLEPKCGEGGAHSPLLERILQQARMPCFRHTGPNLRFGRKRSGYLSFGYLVRTVRKWRCRRPRHVSRRPANPSQ